MARKVHVQVIDDLSGADAQETVRFSLDGADYEIDLSEENMGSTSPCRPERPDMSTNMKRSTGSTADGT